jgi:hypothetical protein
MIIPLPPLFGAFKRPESNGLQVRQQAHMIIAIRVDEAGTDGARVLELLTLNMETMDLAWQPFDAHTTGVGILNAQPVTPPIAIPR